jgi:hypothetical protein
MLHVVRAAVAFDASSSRPWKFTGNPSNMLSESIRRELTRVGAVLGLTIRNFQSKIFLLSHCVYPSCKVTHHINLHWLVLSCKYVQRYISVANTCWILALWSLWDCCCISRRSPLVAFLFKHICKLRNICFRLWICIIQNYRSLQYSSALSYMQLHCMEPEKTRFYRKFRLNYGKTERGDNGIYFLVLYCQLIKVINAIRIEMKFVEVNL